jgi:MFS family permease
VAASPDAGLVAASLAILGVGLGLYHPAGLSLLSRTYRGFHGWSLGIHGVGGAAAIVISPALFGAIAALAGWRVAYVVAGVLSLLLVAMLLVFGRRGEVVRSREPALEVAAGRTSWPLIVLLMVETACTGLVYRGVVTFMPMFYAGEVAPVLPGAVARLLASGGAGSSAALAAAIGGSLASLTYVGAIVGQTMGGWAASSRSFAAWLLGIGAVFTCALFGMGLAHGVPVLAFGLLFAGFYFAAQPITNMMVGRYSRGSRHGIVYGVYFTSGFGTGALAPLVAGWLASDGSLSNVFVAMGVIGVGSVALRAAVLKMVGREGTME